MKSKIQTTILALCAGLAAPKAGADRQDFLKDCMRGIDKLDDKQYEKLPDDAVTWFNSAADVAEANKTNKTSNPLPDFPDCEEDAPAGGGRRRRAADDDSDAAVLGVGAMVTLTTKKGRAYEGKIIERDDEVIVLSVAGEELEFDMAKVESVAAFNDGAGKPAVEEDDPCGVGATVTIKTKRGRTVTGVISAIDENELVLTTDEGDEEFQRSRVESIVPAAAETSTRRRGTSAEEPAAAADNKKPARSRNEGVSIGQRIKELIADNIDATKGQIAKILDKEGLEYRPNTLDLAYNECHKFLAVLKEKKLLKA